MKSKRMISVDFFNDSSFKIKLSNKAKLLYTYALVNADDKGFCNNIEEITMIMNANDTLFNKDANVSLLSDNYENALIELLEKSFLIEFKGNHGNKVHLIRHWYVHNVIPKDRVNASNYEKYLSDVMLDEDNIYNLIKAKNKSDAIQM